MYPPPTSTCHGRLLAGSWLLRMQDRLLGRGVMSELVAASLSPSLLTFLWLKVPCQSSHPGSGSCSTLYPMQILLCTLEDVEGLQSCLPLLTHPSRQAQGQG